MKRKSIILGSILILIALSLGLASTNLQFFRGALLTTLTLNSPTNEITEERASFSWTGNLPPESYIKLSSENTIERFLVPNQSNSISVPFNFIANTNYSWTICNKDENNQEICKSPAANFILVPSDSRGTNDGIDARGLNFSSPRLLASNFTLSQQGEFQVLTHQGQNPIIDRTNQTEAEIRFFSLIPGKFKASILSQLPDTTDYITEAVLQTPADNFQAISNLGATNPVTLKWNKACQTTVDCSTVNNRQYFLYLEAELSEGTGANVNLIKQRYFIKIDLVNPVLGKIITSCSQTANVNGDIICTGRVPASQNLEGLKLNLVNSDNQTVPNSEISCTPNASKELNCVLKAPSTLGTYKIVASATVPPISNEQVGTVNVIDFNDFLRVQVSPNRIKAGDATRIVFNLNEEVEYISLTARVVGPNGFSRTIFAQCHESLTAFECPNKVAQKIKQDRIATDWIADEVPAGMYDIVAFARINNQDPSITATAQIQVEPGTCDTMFTDVQPTDPACEAIADLRTRGIWYGTQTPDGRRAAELNRPLTRAEFFALGERLYQKVNTPGTTSISSILVFNDITEQIASNPNNQFWVKAAQTLLANNIISGFREDNTLRPQAQLRMSELAKITSLSTNFIGFYNDFLNPWYTEILQTYNNNGINFNPEAVTTRRDAVMLIYDTLKLSERNYFQDSILQNLEFSTTRFDSNPVQIIDDGFHNFTNPRP